MRRPPISPLFPYTTLFRSQVGALGRAYQVWGDGQQMAEGFDAEDYFGLSGLSVAELEERGYRVWTPPQDRKSTRLNSSHVAISYAVFCLKKKKKRHTMNIY